MKIFQDTYFQTGLISLITWVIGFMCGKEYAEELQKKRGAEVAKRRETL